MNFTKILLGTSTLFLVLGLYGATVTAEQDVSNQGAISGRVYGQYLKTKSMVTKKGRVTASVLNVRSNPGTPSIVINKLKKGQSVNIADKSGDWYIIKISDTSVGWMHSKYIEVGSSGASKISASASSAAPKNPAEVNTASSKRAVASKSKTVSRGDEASMQKKSTARKDAILGEQIAEYSKKFLGVPYKWGGTTPEEGFDCSGFTYYVFKQFGIKLNRTAEEQSRQGVYVEKSELRPGDLLFFDTNEKNNGEVTHDGLYIGDNKFIHSANPRTVVRITDLSDSFYTRTYVKAKRVIK